MATIVVLDDDPEMRKALGARLKVAGFDVLLVAHPEEARSVVLQARPDLILLDIDMGRHSGLCFHECLKISDRTRNTPVVYLSGHCTPTHVEEAYRHGARAFIPKPYDPGILIATLEGILQAKTPNGARAST